MAILPLVHERTEPRAASQQAAVRRAERGRNRRRRPRERLAVYGRLSRPKPWRSLVPMRGALAVGTGSDGRPTRRAGVNSRGNPENCSTCRLEAPCSRLGIAATASRVEFLLWAVACCEEGE